MTISPNLSVWRSLCRLFALLFQAPTLSSPTPLRQTRSAGMSSATGPWLQMIRTGEFLMFILYKIHKCTKCEAVFSVGCIISTEMQLHVILTDGLTYRERERGSRPQRDSRRRPGPGRGRGGPGGRGRGGRGGYSNSSGKSHTRRI